MTWPGWGALRNGKEYPITVASVDICQNSERRLEVHEGRMWSWAGDGGLFAFRGDRREVAAVSCCLEILYSLPVFNLQPDKPIRDDICLRIGMDSGSVKFFEDTGRIVSEVINYAAHLEKKGTSPGALSVSDEVLARLPAYLKAVFTAKREFEGRTACSTAESTITQGRVSGWASK